MTTTPSGLIIAHDSITAIPLGDHTTIHEQVGGWFDCARQDDLIGYVHDEGLLLGLPLNPIATALFGRIIVGNCVVYNSVDSKGDYDSRKDRHTHVGEGGIGAEGFGLFLNDPRWDGTAMLLETPKEDELADDVRNLAALWDLVEDKERIPPGFREG